MTKVLRPRRFAQRCQYTYHRPLFCSKPDVELPSLMQDYLYKPKHDTLHCHNNADMVKYELNCNLRTILRTYLLQFWRHQVEKESGGCRLWDEIGGFPPTTRPPSNVSSPYYPPLSQNDSIWWRQPAFSMDDEVISPPNEETKFSSASSPNPALSSVSTLSSNSSSSSSSSSTPNSTSNSPFLLLSPSASPGNAFQQHNLENTSISPAIKKTRWQLYAERLFAVLLRVPHFSLDQHMKLLIGMYQNVNTKKDTELTEIVRNYLSTVL